MSSARRPLLTATAAGTLLCALWFVPSAHASQHGTARTEGHTSGATHVTQAKPLDAADTLNGTTEVYGADDTRLADTGSFDTTPYVLGGSLFLTLGAGFVTYSVRRERLGF
ncbi:hypothetical protein KUM39_19085 [Streptomyces sp. J2-1]|uniref:hypothetical protein n=1 Tax=Streptomyces corallincola TaxID=2851888 RepID=UPI001C38A9B0|nr:hypothetical protein [Streptomyces corallincola]MBV2356456.1 hypothetical protein [Streptomyces corallincola]